jgi:hypothetical protein
MLFIVGVKVRYRVRHNLVLCLRLYIRVSVGHFDPRVFNLSSIHICTLTQ